MNRNVLEFSTQWVIQIDDNDQDITRKGNYRSYNPIFLNIAKLVHLRIFLAGWLRVQSAEARMVLGTWHVLTFSK